MEWDGTATTFPDSRGPAVDRVGARSEHRVSRYDRLPSNRLETGGVMRAAGLGERTRDLKLQGVGGGFAARACRYRSLRRSTSAGSTATSPALAARSRSKTSHAAATLIRDPLGRGRR